MAINRLQMNSKHIHKINQDQINNHSNNNNNIYMVVSYIKGLSESFKNFCCKVGVQVHLKEGNTIKNLLASLKDRENIKQKSRVTYRYKLTTWMLMRST